MLPGRLQKILKNQAMPNQKLGFGDRLCHRHRSQRHMLE
jgi:hypothetical protein